MTTAGNFRSTVSLVERDIRIAGVAWPAYKVVALAIGALVLIVVGLMTMSAAAAVLSAAAAATIVWLALGAASSSQSSQR